MAKKKSGKNALVPAAASEIVRTFYKLSLKCAEAANEARAQDLKVLQMLADNTPDTAERAQIQEVILIQSNQLKLWMKQAISEREIYELIKQETPEELMARLKMEKQARRNLQYLTVTEFRIDIQHFITLLNEEIGETGE